ncbi:MAG: hypothetical protein BGO77_05090 [Caedibacter sp. 37-49]|nr:MAG: hypothetical protein BGO77_05090 [Caedibacter sp. 37-49]
MIEKIQFSNEDKKNIMLEQYKLILSSLDKLNDIRELANNFWITINIAGVSAIAYLKDQAHLSNANKSYIIYTLICIGILVCIGWIRNLYVIKQGINVRNELLISIEKQFSSKMFTTIIDSVHQNGVKPSITLSQMIVPLIFLFAYLTFACLSIFKKSILLF